MLCRCEEHEWPNGTKNTYVAKIEPAGQTNESLICGRCDETGAIFLNTRDYEEYKRGKRQFTPIQAATLQIRLSDTPEEVHERNSAADSNW